MFKEKSDKLWYGFLAAAVVLPFIPGVIGGSFFGHVATMILLYAAMAQSWNIISGYCGQTSFGALGLDYPILPDGWKNFSWSDTKNGYYLGALAIFILVFSIVRWIERHRMGYYLRAVREGQETAESLGVNSTVVKLSAMALSASLAALCGSFFAQYNYRVEPPMVMSLDMSMKFVLITILGGLGTFWGPFLGALVLIPLQEYTRAYLSNLGAGVDLMIFGLIIIIVMIKQPLGIMGLIRYFTRKKIVREEGDA